MREITILEGPDGAGKTTLAQSPRFKDRQYIHYGPPPAGKFGSWHQYQAMLKELWEDPNGPDVIIDRFIYGEMVYGPILRGRLDLTWAHIRMLERVLLGMNAELVICLPPWDDICANWDRRRDTELLKTEDQLKNVYQFYQALMSTSDLNRSVYDYTTHRCQAPHPWHGENRVSYRLGDNGPTNKGPGIGAWRPGVSTLLVGEIVNGNAGYDGWPFVATSGCSPWLADLLLKDGISENSLYWINAFDANRASTPSSFVMDLQPKQIISLGRTAEKWCKDHGLDHRHVMHPQGHKRFHHGKRYPLLDMLHD